ncbi:magnesium transporter CorA family protein [Tenuifilum thalassicum]|uniref:Magnesium transporter CorA family protein n=1 Tax=Tenuifilum thalassicum TaxID=2590900 RepID=A0A7D3Y193_9BACT|nr:magnesium transporter CorA family protein [Tenuifilum thalassicum]QKG81053.1 magnesium transporter CorA family protein [Tenuifilum thalassicum]
MISFWKRDIGLQPATEWEPYCWVHVENPTNEEKRYLLDELGVPDAFYNDVEDVDERPRIEYENGWFFILMRLPYKNTDLKIPYTTVPLGIIFKDEVFVSMSFYRSEVIPDFIQFSVRKGILIKDHFDQVLRMMLSSSVWFLKYLKQINNDIKEAEDQLERSIRNEELQDLLRIEKSLVFFTTSLKGNDILLHRIKNLRSYRDTYNPELLEDVEIELRQAQETTSVYSDILSGMMDAYASVISNNLNIVMKRLTSISIVLMIPTLVASFYGMNVPNSFESNPSAFGVIVVVSLLISVFALLLFMRKKWY